MEEHSEPSICLPETNPNLGSIPSPNADPDADQIVEELHEELESQLKLEEAEAAKDEQPQQEEVEEEEIEVEKQLSLKEDSIGWDQDEDFNSGGDINGGEVVDHSSIYNDKYGDEVEIRDGLSNGDRRHHVYPVRPEAEDCSFYIKTGTCKFGSNCKFNHPVRRKHQNQGSRERVNERVYEREQGPERPGQTECKYYLRTGGCKYGKACRYNHSRANSPILPAKTSILPVSDLNFLGLPIRLGERECPYYMRNGSCKYGASCRFNHPDPTAVGGSDPPSAFSNGSSPRLQSSSQSNVASWSSPRGQNESSPFMPITYPPTQGLPSQTPEWNGYQAPVYPPERSMHHPPPQFLINSGSDTNTYAHQQRMPVEEFPERPGQPECSFYMKTGDCKFKSNCKYHHPKNHNSRSPPCILSDKGLPLRPGKNVCSYYSRYGICKYGPACKFDHPIQQRTLSTGSVDDDEDSPYGDSVVEEESRMVDNGNGNNTAIEQSV
ncbi:Zinc finger CCCH domain-containing protein 43 [Euphorbia peplus]|nr:Zinc finger CCCH domain-containing protein 43 [Euphorbia peplus]